MLRHLVGAVQVLKGQALARNFWDTTLLASTPAECPDQLRTAVCRLCNGCNGGWSCHVCCQASHAVEVQADAAEQVKDAGFGNVSEGTRRLASLGSNGTCPQNVERDLHALLRKHCNIPVVRLLDLCDLCLLF